jgi:plasmid stabilization system protein ParE
LPRYEVRSTESFVADANWATGYYLEQAGMASASLFLDRLEKSRLLVAELPGYGMPLAKAGMRWIRIRAFVVVYAVDERNRAVTFLRLSYAASNWKARLLDEDEAYNE